MTISIDLTDPSNQALLAIYLQEHPDHKPWLLPTRVQMVPTQTLYTDKGTTYKDHVDVYDHPDVCAAYGDGTFDAVAAQLLKGKGVIDGCPHPGCGEQIPMARSYGGGATVPRFGTRQWSSIPPWDGMGFCGETHLKQFSRERLNAFNELTRWLPSGAAQLANELAVAHDHNALLTLQVEAHRAGLERLADRFEGSTPTKTEANA